MGTGYKYNKKYKERRPRSTTKCQVVWNLHLNIALALADIMYCLCPGAQCFVGWKCKWTDSWYLMRSKISEKNYSRIQRLLKPIYTAEAKRIQPAFASKSKRFAAQVLSSESDEESWEAWLTTPIDDFVSWWCE